jgi:uncharacterized protein
MTSYISTKFDRYLKAQLNYRLFKGEVIVIYGPRQVGKTTLVKSLLEEHKDARYVLCDTVENLEFWSQPTISNLKNFIGSTKILILDEAQAVKNIGLTLKNIYDNFPNIQVVATGSSSFELSNKIKEALTGRKWELFMYPISISELATSYNFVELKTMLPDLLRTGLYPKILTSSPDDVDSRLNFLTGDYLFKDVLKFERVQSPKILRDLLLALAFQIGQEVSYRELASLLGVNKATVERYIDLLEKAFIIFTLRPLSRNQRKEIATSRKIYFYDLGIRNSLINNFNRVDLRNDIGAMWENFCIIERQKFNAQRQNKVNTYFWRTYDQAEIDYVEEQGGDFQTFEFKWKKPKAKLPKAFLDAYPTSSYQVVNSDNVWDFVM